MSCLQNKYKESGKKIQNSSLYTQLPQTTETEFAKSVSELTSQVHSQTHFIYSTGLCRSNELCVFVSGQIQRVGQKGGSQLFVFKAAGDSGDPSRQRGLRAAEPGPGSKRNHCSPVLKWFLMLLCLYVPAEVQTRVQRQSVSSAQGNSRDSPRQRAAGPLQPSEH